MSNPERWSAEDWDRFTIHAAPSAVAGCLQQVARRMGASARAAQRLADLAFQRIREAERGDWPYKEGD